MSATGAKYIVQDGSIIFPSMKKGSSGGSVRWMLLELLLLALLLALIKLVSESLAKITAGLSSIAYLLS